MGKCMKGCFKEELVFDYLKLQYGNHTLGSDNLYRVFDYLKLQYGNHTLGSDNLYRVFDYLKLQYGNHTLGNDNLYRVFDDLKLQYGNHTLGSDNLYRVFDYLKLQYGNHTLGSDNLYRVFDYLKLQYGNHTLGSDNLYRVFDYLKLQYGNHTLGSDNLYRVFDYLKLQYGNHTLGVLSEIIVRAFQDSLGARPPTLESRLQHDMENTCAICLDTCVEDAFLSACYQVADMLNLYATHMCLPSMQGCLPSRPISALSIIFFLIEIIFMQRESRAVIYHYDGLTETYDKYFFDPTMKSFLLSDEHRMRLQHYKKKSISSYLVDSIARFWQRGFFIQRNKWLETWLRRDLQALLRVENCDVIVHQIAGTIDTFCKRHTKTEATTDELSKEFKEKIMEVVSTYMEAGERERFADETECFLALRLNVEAFDTAYQRYQSQQDHGDDDDDSEIRQWTLREMKSLKLNNRVVMKKCIESARSVKSSAQLVDILVSQLGFASIKETNVFAKRLFNKVSKCHEDQTDPRECKAKVNNSQNTELLRSLGAIDSEGNLTSLGQKMSALEVEPKMGKMLMSSERLGCSEEIITISAMILAKVDAHKEEIARSDHISMLVAYESWQENNFSKKWCIENGVKFSRMENAKSIRQKLERDFENLRIKIYSRRNDVASIKKCITEGYFDCCYKFQSDGSYKSIKAPFTSKTIHPSSTVYDHIPMYVVHSDTCTRWMREVTEVPPSLLSRMAPLYDLQINMPRSIGRSPI
ncbi:uncharacterized protein LOC125578094 [Brassica napus]|uniref:uncharacterized protein LOC125578094 n=1 Tax=Brassica napus TaxID=3708 RepID=UPI002078BDC7|nr:uncharacterized protein LOC125578094 [Brassica napus]